MYLMIRETEMRRQFPAGPSVQLQKIKKLFKDTTVGNIVIFTHKTVGNII